MKNYGFFLLIMLCGASLAGHSQQTTVHFEYDASGNRILRHITSRELKASDSLFLSWELPNLPLEQSVAESEADFRVFPNPATDGLTITYSGAAISDILRYMLYDSQGKVQIQSESNTTKTALDMRQLQSGTYLLRLNYDGKMQVFKVIKQ
ncbi:MAG: T9SS type A sorting domain-containing protein [Bacteroidales bacterium]|nr:T9SS type A sorting domain-containing protein [Acholeplasmataceae bacterium]MCK9449879.1 T9SS type A sorting domain-containing protein [Bacteroidales bacterium]